MDRNVARFIVVGFVLFLIFVFIIVRLFVGGGNDKPEQDPNTPKAPVVKSLPEYADTFAEVSMTIDGRVNGNNEHRAIRITVDKLGARHVAVRSSATSEDSKEAAWAGQLDTFLNVSRSELIKTIEKSWGAVDSDRAKSYAKQKNIKPGKVAVIIQPMQQSETAGIAFSANPVTKNENQIIIEAGLGLGEAVVSGEVTPDTYILDKKSRKIAEKNISNQTKKLAQGKSGKSEWQELGNEGKQQKLTDEKIQELAQAVVKLEEFYGFPVDAEWLMKNNVLFIMQSRPITTL